MSTPFRAKLAIRVYSERPRRRPLGSHAPSTAPKPSEWTLVFDPETTTDPAQRLRFGFFQVRRREALAQEGIFYDEGALNRSELACLAEYARAQRLTLITVETFRKDIFLRYGYTRLATIVGFNLPFDLSRIAIRHGPARGSMRGGFTFFLTNDENDPAVRVKRISAHAALINFARPWEQPAPGCWQRKKKRVAAYRGHFVDGHTFAWALLGRQFDLKTLADHLGTRTRKHDTDEHGKITAKYLDYARADVQVTWECHEILQGRYEKHELAESPSKILSQASIGKAYLRKMGTKPLLACVPRFSRRRLAEIISAYFGGRAEVHVRREICEVRYCDFKSMYPSVNSLMGLSDFVVADGMTAVVSTRETRAYLQRVEPEDLQRPAAWKGLHTLVLVQPHTDGFPARCEYDEKSCTIGLNHLTSQEPLWFTLADCISAKFLTGRCLRVVRAITYRPGPMQKGLVPAKILGRDDFAIDPRRDDLFARLVDLRDDAKARRDSDEKALKTIANATAYGIFIEVHRDDAPKAEELFVFRPDGERLKVDTTAIEHPGRCYHPLLAVLITGAARLMLACAQKRALDLRLDWAFCDTDSLALVRPAGMSRSEFHRRAGLVVDWFVPLNPYKTRGSILKLEEINQAINSKRPEPLFCFAISAKRHVLFNVQADGTPVLRKVSAHGLGHLYAPYAESDAPSDIPKPKVPLADLGVERWQYDLWYKIVEAASAGRPDEVSLDWHPTLQRPAATRYAATSPQLLKWMDRWNCDKHYAGRVGPFGFLMSFMQRTGVFAPAHETLVEGARRGRPPKLPRIAPVAPFDKRVTRAVARAFDRLTGRPVRAEELMTYAEALCQYHVSPEPKFENGGHLDRGRTERRHVIATGFVWIGKEANQVGESGESDPIWSAVAGFAFTDARRSRVLARFRHRGTRPPLRGSRTGSNDRRSAQL
jgi:hypothetical protein